MWDLVTESRDVVCGGTGVGVEDLSINSSMRFGFFDWVFRVYLLNRAICICWYGGKFVVCNYCFREL